ALLRHDVGNKVQIIDGYLDLIDDEFELPEKARKYLQKARKGVAGSIDLIDKVGILRRAGEEEIRKLDIGMMIRESVKEMWDLADESGFRLDIDCPEDVSPVKGGRLLEEVFSNILENSIKHSSGSLIAIRCKEDDQDVICCIEDDGQGIPDDIKDNIFNKGYTSDKQRGTGLGLYLVKLLIERYDGYVEVKDSELGGARFDIHLKK
ncbi:MAG: sensor histidine kinase, partial [Candidatus Saliniplasma sp.]